VPSAVITLCVTACACLPQAGLRDKILLRPCLRQAGLREKIFIFQR